MDLLARKLIAHRSRQLYILSGNLVTNILHDHHEINQIYGQFFVHVCGG